jgi:MFS family permease
MTYFALTLWVLGKTESATAIALITFFFQLPQIGLALFSGLIVDRFSRQRLLILSDVMIAICSLTVGGLAALNQLQLWQLYGIAAVYGCFSHLQTLTHTTIIPLMVKSQDFCASLHTPLIFSSYMAFWYSKVTPEVQGRVFAADHLVGLVVGAIASLMAGPLADRLFEPAMQQGGGMRALSFLGTGTGSGIALLYAIAAVGMVLMGLSGVVAIAKRQSKA